MPRLILIALLVINVTVAPDVCAQEQRVVPAPVGGSRENARAAVAAYPLHRKLRPGELLQLSVSDGALAVRLTADLPAANGPARFEVEGSPATWVVERRTVGKASNYTIVSYYDFAAPDDQLWCSSIILRDDYLSLSASAGEADGVRVRLTQSGRGLRFQVAQIQAGGVRRILCSASADTIRQLRQENPEPVRKYLEPALRKLTGRSMLKPAPADVYRVFESIRPDPAAAGQVAKLVARLDAESFKDREQASEGLAKMGAPAVLAVLRMDLSWGSAELKARVARFLGDQSNAAADARQAAKDPHFLIDCLDDEDVKVRQAARDALAKLLGRTIDFDLSLSGEARSKAVDALRQRLAPALPKA
jgi:hypothetical protein